MRAAGAQLEQQLQAMREENRRLQLQAAASAAAAGSAAPAHVSSSKSSKPKLPQLQCFTGSHGVGFQVESWLRNVKKQFDWNENHFPDDASKIKFASLHLDGPALEWWDSLNKSQSTVIATYDEFVKHLYARYRPQLAAEEARKQLADLRQHGSVSSLSNKVLTLVAHVPKMHEEDKIFAFKRALDSRIAGKVSENKPETLHEAITIAVEAEQYIGRTGTAKGAPYFGGFKGSYQAGRNGAASSSSGSIPMEVNHIGGDAEAHSESEFHEVETGGYNISNEPHQLLAMLQELKAQQHALASAFQKRGADQRKAPAAGNKVPGVSKEEFERCRKEGLCLKCKQSGHLARDCTKPVQRLKW